MLNTLTHEIGHALGLTYSSHEDSIMFAIVTAINNNNKIVKLNIEDILAIQQLYGIKNPRLTTITQPSTTEITTNKPEYVDLCTSICRYGITSSNIRHVSMLCIVDKYRQQNTTDHM